jgi:hypothetical protein
MSTENKNGNFAKPMLADSGKLRYRVREIKYENHTEYWCEKSIRLFGIHIFWDKTTISYHSKFEYAKKDLEDRIGRRVEVIYNFR